MSEAKFEVVRTMLEDHSVVCDVAMSNGVETMQLASCPSERCAHTLSLILNDVTKAILDQGSDRDVVKVASAVRKSLEEVARG